MCFLFPGGFVLIPGRVFSVPGAFSVPSKWVFFVPIVAVERSRTGVLCSSFPDGCCSFHAEVARTRVFLLPAGAGRRAGRGGASGWLAEW